MSFCTFINVNECFLHTFSVSVQLNTVSCSDKHVEQQVSALRRP